MRIIFALILSFAVSAQAELRKSSICSVLLGSRTYKIISFSDRSVLHRLAGQRFEFRYGYNPSNAEPGYHMGYFWPDGPESLPIYVTREGFEAEVISRDGQLTLRGEALHLDVLDIFHKDEVDYLLIRPI